MKNTQNIVIGLLLVSATILTTMLVGARLDQPAYGAASVKDRDYIAVTGSYSTNAELLYVIDAATRTLKAYGFDNQTNAMVPLDTVDLNQLFATP